MARLAAHRDHEVPARGRLGVHHEVADDLHADVAGGLVAEGRNAERQIEVVVDRLRHVHDVDAPGGGLFHLHRTVGGVVSADGDELVDVEPQQRRDGALEQLLSCVGLSRAVPSVEPPRKWMRLTCSIVKSRAWVMSPCISHLNPSSMPTTATPSRLARIVAALITLLIPGAGPPPTRIPSFFEAVAIESGLCSATIVRRRAAWERGVRPWLVRPLPSSPKDFSDLRPEAKTASKGCSPEE